MRLAVVEWREVMTSTTCCCPSNPAAENLYSCPICLLKFNNASRIPYGLNSTHNVICHKCFLQVHPDHQALANLPLLIVLGVDIQGIPLVPAKDTLPLGCRVAAENLMELATLVKTNNVSRAVFKKISLLLVWLTPCTPRKLLTLGKSLGNRILLELVNQNQLSSYRDKQQLWAAIRARSCQFMGPALQDEALKLILLALEDGSALSRKVLIMFVVQRLNPQFPQASKTSIGHVIQLLYRSGCFQFTKHEGIEQDSASTLMTLKQEFRNYEAIRREHDTQIIKIGVESGLHFTPDQWSHILYGDSSRKPLMGSILDKLTVPQSFKQLTAEFLISIQRMQDAEESKLLLDIYPCFERLATLDVNTAEATWEEVASVTLLLVQTLQVLITRCLNLNRKLKRRTGPGTSS